MRLAPSRTRALSWGTRGGEDSSVHPSIHATVSEWGVGGGQCYSPKAKRQTERCDSFPSFLRLCPPPLLPPATFGFEAGGGYFLVWLFLMFVGFFLVLVYFWYPFRGSVTPAATTTVGLRPSLARPGAPSFLGVWNHESVP